MASHSLTFVGSYSHHGVSGRQGMLLHPSLRTQRRTGFRIRGLTVKVSASCLSMSLPTGLEASCGLVFYKPGSAPAPSRIATAAA
jgi:hypothetical protein